MNLSQIGLGLSLILAAPSTAWAANNAVMSCYKMFPVGLVPAAPSRETFVFVDQTTPMDTAIKASLQESLAVMIAPGTAFTIASFSEAAPGKFPVIITSGVIEAGVPPQQRGSIGVPQLKKLDNCLAQQVAFGADHAAKNVGAAMAGAAGTFAHSEILSSLRQLSGRVAASPARDRVVILVSDTLEHSSTTSFFEKKAMRIVKPAEEMTRMKAAGLIGNFRGARVYVIGAGAIDPKVGGVRTDAQMTALETFWRKWFAASNARIGEFGRPNLLSPIPPK